MAFVDHVREQRRLVILRCLAETASGKLNTSVLTDGCNYYGTPATRDDVRTDSAWLAEQGLARVEELTESVQLVVITQRGMDIAGGLATVPGVRKPSPR